MHATRWGEDCRARKATSWRTSALERLVCAPPSPANESYVNPLVRLESTSLITIAGVEHQISPSCQSRDSKFSPYKGQDESHVQARNQLRTYSCRRQALEVEVSTTTVSSARMEKGGRLGDFTAMFFQYQPRGRIHWACNRNFFSAMDLNNDVEIDFYVGP